MNSEQYVFGCSRYIELNPVRAGMASEPGHYSWSSYRHNAQGIRDPLITPHARYRALGAQPADQQAAYRALFGESEMPEALEAIRHAANSGDPLGDDTFRGEIEVSLRRPLTRPPHGGDRRSDAYQAIKPRGESPPRRPFKGSDPLEISRALTLLKLGLGPARGSSPPPAGSPHRSST